MEAKSSRKFYSELKAEILHIQTPPTFDPDENLKGIHDLLSSVDFGNVRLAWEIRGKVSDGTIELIRDIFWGIYRQAFSCLCQIHLFAGRGIVYAC